MIVHIINGNKYEHKGKARRLKVFKLKDMRIPDERSWSVDQVLVRYTTLSSRSELLSRVFANKCEYCSRDAGYFEVHHVRKLADIKGKSKVDKVMIARRRKTLVLCVECHQLLHAGKLPDMRFRRYRAFYYQLDRKSVV